jgi:hypothetical protein
MSVAGILAAASATIGLRSLKGCIGTGSDGLRR